MEIRRISFYDTFSCAASDCRESCCKSWSIPLDGEEYRAYRRVRGLLGVRLRLAIRGGDEPVLNAFRGKCAFLQRDGLCALQVRRGADFPPHVCKVYPRKRTHYGVCAEEYLDLSCIEAAQLFLRADFPLSLVRTKGEPEYGRHGSNEDAAFFARLSASRDALISLAGETARGTEGTNEAFCLILSYATHWQERSARGHDPFGGEEEVARIKGTLFPLRIPILNEWVNGCLYSEDVKRLLPFLERVLKLYFKRFDGLSETEGQRRLDGLMRAYFAAPYYDADKYKKYFCYYLYRYYLETYEDYSFVRRVRDALMHTNLILLLDALWSDEYAKLSETSAARIIAMYEKRVFHNAQIQKDMYGKWSGAEYEVPPVTEDHQ